LLVFVCLSVRASRNTMDGSDSFDDYGGDGDWTSVIQQLLKNRPGGVQTLDSEYGRVHVIPLSSVGSLVDEATGLKEKTTAHDSEETDASSVEIPYDTTYVAGSGAKHDIDETALPVLKSRFEEGIVPAKLRPIVTPGDGQCFLHAVSMILTGSPFYVKQLREAMVDEVKKFEKFYRDTIVAQHMDLLKDDKDADEKSRAQRADEFYNNLLLSCQGEVEKRENWAGLEEAFVLANAIRRPIIIYADKEQISMFSESLVGVGGALLPLRHDPEECSSKVPILVSWTRIALHFVPVVRVCDWGDDKIEPIKFPTVHPVLVEKCTFSGDPEHSSEELTAKEQEAMNNYVDYNAPIKKPPESLKNSGVANVKNGVFCNQPIPGFEKTVNPENGRLYDIVVPVDLGKSVCYIAFDFGEDFTVLIAHFVRQYCNSCRSHMYQICNYITTLLFRIRVAYQESISDGRPLPKLSDFAPLKLNPSVPTVNDYLDFVAQSILCNPAIPVSVPCRFVDEVSDKALNGMMQAVLESFGVNGNSIMDQLLTMREFMSNSFLLRTDSDEVDTDSFQITPPGNYLYLFPRLALASHYKSFELFDVLRYFALNPLLCSFFGKSLVEWCVVPDESDPFCCHVAFIQMLANIFSCYAAIEVEPHQEDMMKSVTESAEFISYFDKASRSKTPDLLIALSVMFLDVAVMNTFSPLNVIIARLYPRILLTAIRLKHKALVRNILMGMATLIYNDKAAKDTLASCRPLPAMLSEAESLCDDRDVPYATFCSSALTDESLSSML